MRRFLDRSALLLRLIGRVEMLVGSVILIGIVGSISVQVLLNAGLGNPIPWEQEGGAYALVWLTFIGASLGLKQMRHITIVAAVSPLPPRIRAAVRMLGWAIVIWMLITVMRELVGVMAIEGRARTVALPVSLPRSWFFSVPLFMSSALMAWTALHYLLANIPVLMGYERDEPAAVIEPDDSGAAA